MNIQKIKTIQEMKDSQTSNLTYEIKSVVDDIFRTAEGLNIFTITDGIEKLKLTVFVPKTPMYPEIAKGSIARFQFTRRNYEGQLQGNLVNAFADVSNEDELDVKKQILEQSAKRYRPKNEDLLINEESFEKMKPSMMHVATIIRQAVFEKRPIHITHHGDTDGYAAGRLLEHAIVGLINQTQPNLRFIRNFFSRNPSKTPYYDLIDATKDIGFFQDYSQRFDLPPPLIIITDNGSTPQDLASIQKVKLFGADVVVIDHHDPGKLDPAGKSIICKEVLGHVNPHLLGLGKNISASMLAFQVAHFINDGVKPMASLAALGGVADKCTGKEIDFLIKLSTMDKDFLEKLHKYVDYEIYHTKFNQSNGALFTLLEGPLEKQKAMITLYEPILDKATKELQSVVTHYAVKKQEGNFTVFSLDGEGTTFWSDYYSIGKLAAILHAEYESIKQGRVTMVYSDSIIVFRVSQDEKKSFDVNKLIVYLQEKLPFARISGGGHDVAGSIKFLSIAKKDVLEEVARYTAAL